MASFRSSSLKTGRLIFKWPLDSLQHCQPWFECLEPPDLLDLDDTDEEVDTELSSLSNTQSGAGKGDGGVAACSSHCLWPWSLSFYNAWPCSLYDGLGSCLGTSHCSAAVVSLAAHRHWSWLQKLNGDDAGRMEQGHLGPLGSMHCLVMAWLINHQPLSRLTGMALSWACLPTQLMAPDSMNAASHTSPKLSPSPKDCCP